MEATQTADKLNTWALVELFGRQRIVGKVTEQIVAGTAMLRVDVPKTKHGEPFTRFYNPSAIYGLSPINEELALRLLERQAQPPVMPYQIPQLQDVGDDE